MGKMEFNGKVYGVIVLKPPIAWINDAEEQSLMEELLGDIGFALANIERMQQLEASEEKIREAEVFKQVDRLRSEFLANVSHELRTPLTSIKGYASTLLRQDVTWSEEERIDFIKIIEAETDRLTQFIGDLLDMSRLEAGAMPLEKEEHAVRDIIDTVKSRLETLAAKHRLVYIIPGDLPSVFADNMRIGQVFSNLVDNAVKHSPPQSEITLEARQSGEEIVFSVTDRGEGISSEHLEKIFDRFYQVRQRSRGHKAGTGLGLSICKGIVEQHGGRIWVESEVDKGSKFSFSMPVYKEELNA
jgi:two-component system sensor histidine kinase KdpD